MRTLFKIAKAELQVLFYSPVAWLILIIFTIQASILFIGRFDESTRNFFLGNPQRNVTLFTFYGFGYRGFFLIVQQYLYLYIPLLTMGVMSREIGSGSIKLLYSSPVTNRQIIMGKYLALIIYGFSLIAILGLFSAYTVYAIEPVDIPPILSGLLGIYLLLCTYAAIGLFMSSITSYTVVAAMGTLAVFALLTYVRSMWQEIELVRDITYWFAITGRSDNLIAGLITSEDIIYFLMVIGLFLGMAIIRLQNSRQKSAWYVTSGKYAALVAIAMLIGYYSSQPKFRGFYDTTRTKQNTLTEKSQDVVAKLDDGLTITTYVNMLDRHFMNAVPTMQKLDMDRFKRYTRFKPDIRLKYKYYYHRADYPELDDRYPGISDKQRLDSLNKVYNWNFPILPYEAIQNEVDLSGENFRFVRLLERDNGERTFLRIYDDMMKFPLESEVTAAFKRLVMELPVVGFVTGHGERQSGDIEDRGYNMFAREKTFRYAMINQGFDFADIALRADIPEHVRILVIAEPRSPFSDEELAVLDRYIARGGNLILANEPGRESYTNIISSRFGVTFDPGVLVSKLRNGGAAEERVKEATSAIKIHVEGAEPDKKDTAEVPKPTKYGTLLLLPPTDNGVSFSHHIEEIRLKKQVLTMPSASIMKLDTTSAFKQTVLFETAADDSWNELETTNFVDDTVRYNATAGEVMGSYPTVVALSRQLGDKEQRILVTADADWLSNSELGMGRKGVKAGNFNMIMAAFFWLSHEEIPIDIRREIPPDKISAITQAGWEKAMFCMKWILPLTLIAIGTIIWIRRRGR